MPRLMRILSIDGGGIRGIIPAQILVTLEDILRKRTGNPNAKIADYFDLIAGTSAGGILTCFYLCPEEGNKNKVRYSAEHALEFYVEKGHKIFSNSLMGRIKSVGGWNDEMYPDYELKKVLRSYFGLKKLSDLVKPCLITSYDIERRCAHFFTQHNAKKDRSRDYFIRNVARATSAAPTYFEAAKIKSLDSISYCLIDGAMFANNPALCAYAETRKLEHKPTGENMLLLSISTGNIKTEYSYEKAKDWGKIGWIRPSLDIMMSGVSETVDYQLREVFEAVNKGEQYLRIDPALDKNNSQLAELDNASHGNVETLLKIGASVADKYYTDLEKIAMKLIDNNI